MSDSILGVLFGLSLGVFVMFILSIITMPSFRCSNECKEKAIEFNLAEYNNRTGKFQWLNDGLIKLTKEGK